ncbi:hypothetical protein [Xanthobacter autotrophicus]|uniref:hypothetical protein n=1 Tax=Xanthobacter autotrophicus TaxID=280 RepID=UPI003727F988
MSNREITGLNIVGAEQTDGGTRVTLRVIAVDGMPASLSLPSNIFEAALHQVEVAVKTARAQTHGPNLFLDANAGRFEVVPDKVVFEFDVPGLKTPIRFALDRGKARELGVALSTVA